MKPKTQFCRRQGLMDWLTSETAGPGLSISDVRKLISQGTIPKHLLTPKSKRAYYKVSEVEAVLKL